MLKYGGLQNVSNGTSRTLFPKNIIYRETQANNIVVSTSGQSSNVNTNNANYIQVIITVLIFASIIILTHFAFVYSKYIIKFAGAKNFVIIGKVMGLVLGVIGANMLIEGIKLAFNV